MFIKNTNSPPINLDGVNYDWYENIQYGSTNRETLDIFIPTDSISPTGVVVYMHAGGFVQWDKSRAYSVGGDIKSFLQDGIAYATINYDLLSLYNERKGVLSCMNSGKKSIQFLKFYADFFNLDKTKFIIKGASAGAGIAQWIAYQNNLAEASSQNAILREDTYIKAITLLRPQATYDYLRWEEDVFKVIPDYSIRKDYENNTANKLGFDRTYGTNNFDILYENSIVEYRNSVDILKHIETFGGIETFINSPDTFYTQVVDYTIPDISHSPFHGQTIKNYLDDKGTPNIAYLNGLYQDPSGETENEFIRRKIDE